VGLSLYALLVGPTPHWAADWLPGVLVAGVGLGMTLPVLNASATHSLPADRFAIGSAINSMFLQLGAVLGVSVFVAVLGTPRPATVLADFDRSWWVIVGLSLASCAVWLLPRRRSHAS
jgi:MFS family permease